MTNDKSGGIVIDGDVYIMDHFHTIQTFPFFLSQKSIMTATTTRRKQQQEMLHRALLAEEDRRRAARENFHMLAVPLTQHAAYEPALHHAAPGDPDHEEGTAGMRKRNKTKAFFI